jgi:hypothetical protein
MAQRIAIRIDVGPTAPLEVVTELIQSTNTVCNVALALDRQSELNRARRLPPLDETALTQYLQLRSRSLPHDYPDDPLNFPGDDMAYRYRGRFDDLWTRLLVSRLASGPSDLWSPAEAQVAYLLGALQDAGPPVPTVRRISYNNPFEMVLEGVAWGHLALSGAAGGSLFALLNFIAYVGPKRDKMKAEAEKTRAEAKKTTAEARRTEAEATKLEAEAQEAQARAYQIQTAAQCKAEVTRALLLRVQEGQVLLTPEQIDEIVDDKAVGAILELTKRPLEIEDQSDDKAS